MSTISTTLVAPSLLAARRLCLATTGIVANSTGLAPCTAVVGTGATQETVTIVPEGGPSNQVQVLGSGMYYPHGINEPVVITGQ
jgi:hypothetical protein